jgi:signal peptidase I
MYSSPASSELQKHEDKRSCFGFISVIIIILLFWLYGENLQPKIINIIFNSLVNHIEIHPIQQVQFLGFVSTIVRFLALAAYFYITFLVYFSGDPLYDRSFLRYVADSMNIFLITWLWFLVFSNMFVHYSSFTEYSLMQPTIKSQDRTVMTVLAYITSEPARGDIVSVSQKKYGKKSLIVGRIVGLPGEKVKIIEGHVEVNGELLSEPYIGEFCEKCFTILRELESDQYLIAFDARMIDDDGLPLISFIAKRSEILGKHILRYWPIDRIRILPDIVYPSNVNTNGPQSSESIQYFVPMTSTLIEKVGKTIFIILQ